MTDLASFLLDRIREDEELARAAPGPKWVRKYRQRPEPPFAVERYAIASPVEFMGEELGSQTVAFTEDDSAEAKALVYHAVAWDPARVLAECAAKRRIVEGIQIGEQYGVEQPTWILGNLALPYADHPDFDQGTFRA